jgi:hypothetical protein
LKNTLIVVQQQTRVKLKGLCDYFLNEWTGIDGWMDGWMDGYCN